MAGVDVDTIVVGAGPAGLAVGAALRRKRLPFLMLERGDRVGSSWRHHYERLHLHTPKQYSALPFRPYPRSYPRYPSRDQVVEYLVDYARAFQLEPEFGRQVVRCSRDEERLWTVEVGGAAWRARRLVLASGFNRVPHRPSWPGQESFPGPILHSHDYSSGERFRGQRVLVVGLGNSGAELALDLWEQGAAPALAVRGGVNIIPRDVLGIPATALALACQAFPPRLADRLNALTIRLTVGDLTRYGLARRGVGPFAEIVEQRHVPVMDVGTLGLLKRGQLPLRSGIERFEGADICFTDGRREPFDAVVLATGFGTGLRGMLPANPDVLDDHGRPRAFGRETAPGLYFCGFNPVPTGLLREIGREAMRIGDALTA